MAYGDDNIISTTLATAGFVPDLWADEIMAAYKSNLVLAALVRKLNVKGKKGDSVTLPTPGRGSATSKVADTIITTSQASGSSQVVNLTGHWQISYLIEDIAEAHALASMRKFYTDDAGYGVAKAKDTQLFNAGSAFGAADLVESTTYWSYAVIGGDGITDYVNALNTVGNQTAISDAGLRRVIQTLDDNNTPMTDRFLVIPPVGRRVMMGLARFTEQAFIGNGDAIKNGKLGQVYGVAVHVSANCPKVTSTLSTDTRIAMLAHRDALVLCEVLGPRTQAQYKQEYLGTLVTADTIFGAKAVYADGGRNIAVPA